MGSSVSVGYFLNLEENIEDLKSKTERVEAQRDDVLHRIVVEERKGQQRLSSVEEWLLKVQVLASKSRQLLNDAQIERNRLCLLGYCSWSFSSTYKYGKKVYSLLKEVESLESQALRFRVLAELPIFSSPVVDQDRRLEQLRRLVMEDRVGIIGIYGMGGVGKTTLVSLLYNRISVQEGHPSDNLFWIMVSTDVEIHRIQDNIGKQLALYNEEWEQKSNSQKAVSIHSSLRIKRFLVVLDDLRKELDLESIGIPFPTRENGCKIIITSRSRDICVRMGAEFFTEVKPLKEDQAWDLFQRKVGETTLQSHPEILQLARRIAATCRGLPLALLVTGASMASQTSVQAWRHALDQLTRHVRDDPDDSIYICLKHGYDALESKQVKLCFLFFALFPEVEKEYLVELWIGEGIIDENNNQDRAKGRGYEIIRILLARSLVMEAGESRDKLRIHEVLREFAFFYKASRTEIDKEDSIVESFTQVGRRSDIKNRKEVSRVSIVGDDIKTLSGDFDCPKLRTLFLRDTRLETISPEFFSGMPLLLVLDLSSNEHLNILPDTISELVSLRYLNLSSTGIKRLPLGLSKLKKLAYLYLEHTHLLKDITGISHIVNIQVLRLRDSGFRASHTLVEELKLLESLELLTITLQDEDVVKHFLTSPKLAKCTQGFYLNYCAILSSISFTSLSSSLRCLDVQDSYIPEVMIDRSATGGEAIIALDAIPSDVLFTNLNEVRLDGCNGLRELTWLLYAPNLKKLRVMQSRDIEEIISKKKAANLDIVPFQKLEFLALEGLERLRSIYWRPLPLPELREIRIRSCPGLTKLPINSESAKGQNLVLSAEKEWMKEIIEWEDGATKQRLFPS